MLLCKHKSLFVAHLTLSRTPAKLRTDSDLEKVIMPKHNVAMSSLVPSYISRDYLEREFGRVLKYWFLAPNQTEDSSVFLIP